MINRYRSRVKTVELCRKFRKQKTPCKPYQPCRLGRLAAPRTSGFGAASPISNAKMVLKSTKSKSKRRTLRHKYKVIKKVKQHHQKKAKEEKKKRKAGIKPKALKDPGIPTQWPFKEELLKDLEWQKQRILAQEKAKKEERKLKRVSLTRDSFSITPRLCFCPRD